VTSGLGQWSEPDSGAQLNLAQAEHYFRRNVKLVTGWKLSPAMNVLQPASNFDPTCKNLGPQHSVYHHQLRSRGGTSWHYWRPLLTALKLCEALTAEPLIGDNDFSVTCCDPRPDISPCAWNLRAIKLFIQIPKWGCGGVDSGSDGRKVLRAVQVVNAMH